MFLINRKSMSPWRTALLEMNEQGMLDKDSLIRDLLGWLSEHDVKQFCLANDIPITDDAEDLEEDDVQVSVQP